MSWDQLRATIATLEYPDNHNYDPESLEPDEKLRRRLEILRTNAPELFAGGESLLDVGANKGYFCLALRDVYEKVTGYDKAPEYVEFCQQVARGHGAENVEFLHGEFRDIPLTARGPRYDTVYVANCHHYFFFDCARSGAPPLLFLKKLAALCNKHLILDGPLEMSDPAVTKLCGEGAWSGWVQGFYTRAEYEKALAPQFLPVRVADNGLGRTTAVFTRVAQDVPYLDATELRRILIRRALPIESNPRRGPDACFLLEDKRYKFDLNPVPDGILLILNYLAPRTPHTESVLTYKGARVGDVAAWIWGDRIDDSYRLLKAMLTWNKILGTMGLIQCDFEPSDFKQHHDADEIVNVDLDMIRHVSQLDVDIVGDLPIHGLMRSKAEACGMAPKAIDKMLGNLGKKRIFDEILEGDDWYVEHGKADA